jgi:hypothetical protein
MVHGPTKRKASSSASSNDHTTNTTNTDTSSDNIDTAIMWSSNSRGAGAAKKNKGKSSGQTACQQSVEKMFAEIADEDDAEIAGLEGTLRYLLSAAYC